MDYRDTCEKLFRLYSQATTEHEKQAAFGRLMTVIDKHRLDITIADLESGRAFQSEIVAYGDAPLYLWHQHDETWRKGLVIVLCCHFGVAVWQHIARVVGRKRMGACCLCGRPEDVAMVRELYTLVSTEALRLWKLSHRTGRAQKCSWMRGFMYGVKEQLELSKQRIQAEATASSSKAMVLLDQRLAQSQTALEQKLPNLKNVSIRRPSSASPDAFFEGRRHGREVHLGRSLPAPDGVTSAKACGFCGSTHTQPPGGGIREHYCESCGSFFC